MKPLNHRKLLAGTLLAALSTLASAATPIVEIAAPLDARGTLEASNVRGRISVTAWDRNEVSWSGALGAGTKLVVEKTAARISLSVEAEEGRSWIGWNKGPREDSVLVIKVPANASLDLSAVSANIDVTAMRGSSSIEVESVSGEVAVRASSTDKLEVSSVSGDVTFEGQAGRVDAETVSGDLRISGDSRDVSVETVSGSASVRAQTVKAFDGSSVSGDIDFGSGILSVFFKVLGQILKIKMHARHQNNTACKRKQEKHDVFENDFIDDLTHSIPFTPKIALCLLF